jgi:hypothetical protein
VKQSDLYYKTEEQRRADREQEAMQAELNRLQIESLKRHLAQSNATPSPDIEQPQPSTQSTTEEETLLEIARRKKEHQKKSIPEIKKEMMPMLRAQALAKGVPSERLDETTDRGWETIRPGLYPKK